MWSTGLLDLAPGLSQGCNQSPTLVHVGMLLLLQEHSMETVSHKEADEAAKVAC